MMSKSVFASKLKPNPDKIEFILLSSRTVHIKLGKVFPVNILGNLLSPPEIRNLGVRFDSNFFFGCHVRNICKACFVRIRDLKQLRGYLCEAALFWPQTPWLEVDLTTVISCLEVSLLLTFQAPIYSEQPC